MNIIQNFTIVTALELNFPPLFTRILAWFRLFTLENNLFAAACTIKAEEWKKWLGIATGPYLMILPVIVAGAVVRGNMTVGTGEREDVLRVKRWNVNNGGLQTACILTLYILPRYVQKLMEPFECLQASKADLLRCKELDNLP